MKPLARTLPALPPGSMFVVQFREDTAWEKGQISGRVEHISSGNATSFHSLDRLVDFMAEVLRNRIEASEPNLQGPHYE